MVHFSTPSVESVQWRLHIKLTPQTIMYTSNQLPLTSIHPKITH